MYYRIPALELSLSVPLVLLLQAVFRRAGARGLIYDFLLLSCGIRLLMFQPCFDRILICLIRSLIFYSNIIRKYGISFHCYADDTQLYISTKPDETSKLSKLTECVKNIKDWMTSNFLLLNSDKTEILLIGPKNSTQNLLDYNLQKRYINIGDLT